MNTIESKENIISMKYCNEEKPLIIIGSGLAGHSAAAEAYQNLLQFYHNDETKINPKSIIVLEKEESFGGNSMKATSGINGVLSEFQSEQKIEDNLADFQEDVMYSYSDKHGEKVNDLVKVLTESSGDALHWLKREFGLQLTSISQCGGHSHPRTHRPPSGPVGTMIVKSVHNRLQNLVEFRYNCEVTELLMDDESKRVIGVKYLDKSNPKQHEIKALRGSAVILASGGYANDHTSHSLLDQYSLMEENKLPTTNGLFATGDGVKMGQKIGANLVDMSAIQIHPTGFIDPKKPNERTKYLAPEALRGSGGILINNNGHRFVNELDLRNKVVDKEREQQKIRPKEPNERSNEPFRILLNEEAATKFGPNLGFYIKMGLITKYNNVGELAEDSGIPVEALRETLLEYSQNALSGKPDKFGKNVYPVTKWNSDETIYSALITPVVHYTMGGLQVNTKAQILDKNGEPIHGLFGAGEVTGGVHGLNRLAGNSLLECVVFGRISGRSAVQYCQKMQDSNIHDEL